MAGSCSSYRWTCFLPDRAGAERLIAFGRLCLRIWLPVDGRAAKILGLHPNYLHKLIRTMDLKPALKRTRR